MISQKISFYLALTFFLIAAGMTLLIWELVLASLPCIIYLVLSLHATEKNMLRCRWTVSATRVFEGQNVRITVKLFNAGRNHVFCILTLKLPGGITVANNPGRLGVKLSPRSSETVWFDIPLKRFGVYTIGPLIATQRGLTGSVVAPKVLIQKIELKVFPRPEHISHRGIRLRKTKVWLGSTPSKIRGHEGEFYSIRKYQYGDTLRAINWRASARANQILTNEFVGERGGDVILIVDARGPHFDEAFIKSVRTANQVSSLLLRQGHRVGLVVLREFIDRVYPSHGKVQEMRISEALIRSRPGGETYVRDVTWLLTRFFPRKGLAIVITPLRDEEIVKTLITLARAGVEMLVLSPDYIGIPPRKQKRDEVSIIAKRLVEIERRTTLKLVSRFATVIPMRIDDPISLTLRSVDRVLREKLRLRA